MVTTQFSAIVSVTALFNAISMPIAGYLVDRFGARRVIAAGCVLGSAGYAATALAQSFGGFIALASLTVELGNLASYPAFMALAQRWFDKRLGVALALTSTGLAVGTAGFSDLIATLIAERGWRAAFIAGGAVALAIGLANLLFFIRDNPGPLPEAEERDSGDAEGGIYTGVSEALRTRDFWLYSLSFLLINSQWSASTRTCPRSCPTVAPPRA